MTYNEERIAELLGALPPAPEAWVRAAQELPRARRDLDEIVARAEADLAFRKALIADLEAALAAEDARVYEAALGAMRSPAGETAEERDAAIHAALASAAEIPFRIAEA